MKKVNLKSCIVYCLLMITTASYSQNVQFAYDETGNRISRIIVIPLSESKSVFTDSILPGHSRNPLNQNLENLRISVFPNPTSDIIHIQCNDLSRSTSIDAYLYTAKGEALKTINLCEFDQVFDMTNYPLGIYYLKIQMNDRIESWKIIKQQ
ncbi:MAG: T9SS type A sorting domain-containing protein [Bacteroidales bacterium]|nr:T9SS type A sorting domain-containing protein [Bacteroidales bacterium]